MMEAYPKHTQAGISLPILKMDLGIYGNSESLICNI